MSIKLMINSIVFLFAISACSISGQKYKTLSPADFQKKMQEGTVQLLDVRTPSEYAGKHLAEAVNVDFNSDDFVDLVSKLDKTKPVLVYCLSGGRSEKAAALISKKGCSEVYNLKGGLLAWTAAGLPVEGAGEARGLSMDDYLAKVKTDKLVLVDFNAVWCGPCKMLKPILDKVADKNKDKVTLLPIDVDQNSALSNAMHIDGIPLLIMYKAGKEVWRNVGLTDYSTLEDAIKANAK